MLGASLVDVYGWAVQVLPSSTLQKSVGKWAHQKGIMQAAEPVAQMGKTLEEIGEAKQVVLAIERVQQRIKQELGKDPVMLLAEIYYVLSYSDCKKILDHIEGALTPNKILDALKWLLSLEYGDILVTLCIQAQMQGSDLETCKDVHYFNPALSASFRNRPITWQFVDEWAHELNICVCTNQPNFEVSILPHIGALCHCVADAAQITLAMSAEECLGLALEKIRDRTGEVIDGVFIKDE